MMVSLSSTESEYKALSQGSTKIVWLKNLLNELQLNYVD